MPFPKDFYSQSKSGENSYSFELQGQLDINRMVRSKPYWKKPAKRKPQPKTLILADWRAGHWSPEEVESIKSSLFRLINEGFSVYLWQEKTFKPLTKENIATLTCLGNEYDSTLEYPDELIKQASLKLGRVAEEIHILDDYWLQVINEEKPSLEAPVRTIKSADCDKHTHLKKVLAILQQAKPPVELVELNTFTPYKNKEIRTWRSRFPQIRFSSNYRILQLENGWGAHLLEKGALTDQDATFVLANLSGIEELKVSETQLSIELLEKLLTKIANIKKLDLSYNRNHITGDFSQNLNLSSLETLDLSFSSVSGELLKSLLTKSPNLKRLNLHRYINLRDDFSQNLNLSSLETIELGNTSISNEGLNLLFTKTPNLKTLNLFKCNNIKNDLSSDLILPSLENLNLSSSTISSGVLQSLLVKTPNIKRLNLASCKHLTDDGTQKLNLPALEYLDLSNSLISNELLQSLLANGANLRKLDLSNCYSITSDFSQNLNLSSLEDLDLSSTPMNGDALQNLLAKTPNLKRLKLSDCDNITLDFLQSLNLSSLEELNLSNCSINSEELSALLAKAPKLKRLKLYWFKNITADFSPDFNLSSLEELELVRTSISSEGLNTLLAKAPNLKSFKLTRCKNVKEDFSQNLNLSSLKDLDIINCPINNAVLNSLLTKTPNLDRLSLSKLKNDITQALDLLPELEQLKLYDTSVSSKLLINMISKSPEIKSILLYDCNLINDEFNKDLDLLPNLENIEFYNTSTGSDFLRTLLAKTPNVNTLKLSEWDNTTVDIFQNQVFPHMQSLYLIKTSVDGNTLKKILLSMPNLEYLEVPKAQIKIDESLQELLQRIKHVVINQDGESNEEQYFSEPVHNPQQFKYQKPTPKSFKFQFNGVNKSFNQNMIIEKLSQYLTLTRQHRPYIPKIQNGICNALVHLALEQPLWGHWLKLIASWDGSEHQLNQERSTLDPIFASLMEYIKKYQFGGVVAEETYLGDDLASFLETCSMPIILSNPWHAVSVQLQAGQWIVDDPNFMDGPKTCNSKTELLTALKQSLGTLISVTGTYPSSGLEIQQPLEFIRDGGLLVLCNCINKSSQLLAQLPPAKYLSHDTLEGLFLRDIKGVPAWNRMLGHPQTSSYAVNLLKRFSELAPRDYKDRIRQSLDALTPHACHESLVHLQNLFPHESQLVADIAEVLRKTVSDNYYDQQLQTWVRGSPDASSPDALCQQMFQGEKRRRLIELDSAQAVQSMQLILERFCHNTSRPVFYIDSPDDLVCSAPFIKKTGSNGVLHHGPGGRLYDFLMAHQNSSPAPLILVNYDNFEVEDLIRFNQLVDKIPLADGTPLPSSAQVIGLINPNKPGAYQGEDFYSRFDEVLLAPFTGAQLAEEVKPLPIIAPQKGQLTTAIDLYKASDWQERLLGRWVIQKDRLVFQDGELIKALQTGRPLEIRNGLWEDPAFHQFWQHAFLRGYIDCDGGRIDIPEKLQLVQKEGYDWSRLASHVSFTNAPGANALVINSGRINALFQQYQCDTTTHTLDTLPGLLAEQASQGNKQLDVFLTSSLTEDEWAMILDESQKHQIDLTCYCAPSATPPEQLHSSTKLKNIELPLSSWDKSIPASLPTMILESSDADTTVALLTENKKDWTVIDVSECQGSDLLRQLKGTLNQKELRFEFTQSDSALITALANNQKVILKGRFSPDLCDELAPFLVARMHQGSESQGQLILVSEDTTDLDYLPRQRHAVSAVIKREALAQSYPQKEVDALDSSLLEHESLSRLKARLVHRRIYGDDASTDEAWQGLYHLPGAIRLNNFDAKHSAEKAHAFNKQRLDAVNAVLAHAPYVFITGHTGVGKSTFVEKNFKTDAKTTLYQGESSLKEWAQDRTPGKRKILFLDEANLSPRQWSELEGLFQFPPGVLIDGQFCPLPEDLPEALAEKLTEDHKIVIAGNPLQYGDERTLAPFFERHGNALVFEPMPLEFIYEETLKPVFENTALQSATLSLCHPILDVYKFICECSQDKILISPRELQMMALLVLSYAQKNTNQEDCLRAAEYYARQIGRNLVPEQHRLAFDTRFKAVELRAPVPVKLATRNPDFLTTPSHQPAIRQLDEMLSLHQFKLETASNEAQRHGGLGGIVLEGEPGIGKSELVMASLRAHGYEQVHDIQKPSSQVLPAKLFYHVPVSMQTEDKIRLIMAACRVGAVIVMDEINSSPMMEALLNKVLRGKMLDGQPIAKPVLVIGTQNPVTMKGRRKPSTALERRLLTITLPSYTQDEMKNILLSKGVDKEEADLLIAAYEKNVKKAQREHYTPAPTFRDLVRLADQVVKGTLSREKISTKAPFIFNELSEFERLQSALIQKINDYRTWRADKSTDDGRGYLLGFFTRLRHWTKFGENRANALLENIKQCETMDDIRETLREHFSQDSRLNNHSLDTYLLEAVNDFPETFGIQTTANLRIKEGREQLLEEIMIELNSFCSFNAPP